jgi:two-component system cell cycle sensor histidine kinase PleC
MAVGIDSVVQSSCDVLTETAKGKGLSFTTAIDKNLPEIRADLRATRQILLNLLSNAVKFTPSGGEVHVRASHGSNNDIVISVSDTGPGIATEDLDKILMPFTQAGANGTSGESGTGLGLSIVNSLIDLQGGTLKIESNIGEGTCVTVHFPKTGAAKMSVLNS